MEIIKKKDRMIGIIPFIKGLRAVNVEVESIGEFMKWKELDGLGTRISVTITVYEIKGIDGKTGYIMSDALARVMCNITTDLDEIKSWLSNHGYKTDKQFYMDDGMSEETWNEWNRGY